MGHINGHMFQLEEKNKSISKNSTTEIVVKSSITVKLPEYLVCLKDILKLLEFYSCKWIQNVRLCSVR